QRFRPGPPGRQARPLPRPRIQVNPRMALATSWTGPLLGLAANGMLALGSYAIARHALGRPRGLDRTLAAGLVYWSALTVGLELLGTFGALGIGPMLAWSAAILATGMAWWFLHPGEGAGAASVGAGAEPLTRDARLVLALVLAAVLLRGLPSL